MPIDTIRSTLGLEGESETDSQPDMNLNELGDRLDTVERAVDYGSHVVTTGNLQPGADRPNVRGAPPPLFGAIGPGGGIKGAVRLIRGGDDVARGAAQASKYADDVTRYADDVTRYADDVIIRGEREILAGGPRDVAAQQLADDVLRQRQILSGDPRNLPQSARFAERVRESGTVGQTLRIDPADPAYLQRARQGLSDTYQASALPRHASEIAPPLTRTISSQRLARRIAPFTPIAAGIPLAGFQEPHVTTEPVAGTQLPQPGFDRPANQPVFTPELSEFQMGIDAAIPRQMPQNQRYAQRVIDVSEPGRATGMVDARLLTDPRALSGSPDPIRPPSNRQPPSPRSPRGPGGPSFPPLAPPPLAPPPVPGSQPASQLQIPSPAYDPFVSIQPVATASSPFLFGDKRRDQFGQFSPRIEFMPAMPQRQARPPTVTAWGQLRNPDGTFGPQFQKPRIPASITPWGQLRNSDGTFGPQLRRR